MIKYLDNSNEFDDLTKSKILVDFYADWCGPCRMLSPILESIDKVDILKVNVDKYNDISNRFGVMSIPTLIYFVNGIEKSRLIGLKNKEDILNILE